MKSNKNKNLIIALLVLCATFLIIVGVSALITWLVWFSVVTFGNWGVLFLVILVSLFVVLIGLVTNLS